MKSSKHHDICNNGIQKKYRPGHRFLLVQFLIALSSPRTIGLIDAWRNNYHKNIGSCRINNEFSSSDVVIRRGHSHNDYHQKRPLQSAILHGLRSIEVDVFPIEGELFVAHTRLELDEKKTIDNMYIYPILELLESHKSKKMLNQPKGPFPVANAKRDYAKVAMHPNQIKPRLLDNKMNQLLSPEDDSLILLVDFKSNPNTSVELLNQALQPLKPYLSKVKNGKFHKGKVTVLISGNRPGDDMLYENAMDSKYDTNNISTNHRAEMRRDDERFLFIDGRVNDLHREESKFLVPMISLNWTRIKLYQLIGKGDEYMKKYADLAHSQGKRLRIWGAPNDESVWRRMMRNGIDWLSIDDHERFARFASKYI